MVEYQIIREEIRLHGLNWSELELRELGARIAGLSDPDTRDELWGLICDQPIGEHVALLGEFAQSATDPNWRVILLERVARRNSGVAPPEVILLLMKHAVASTDDIVSPWQQAERLHTIADWFHQQGLADEAQALLLRGAEIAAAGAQSVNAQDSIDSAKVLRDVILSMAQLGNVHAAEAWVSSIPNLAIRDSTIARLRSAR
jgi:hypothetical protein